MWCLSSHTGEIVLKASMKSIPAYTGLISPLPNFFVTLIKSFHHFYRTQKVVILVHCRDDTSACAQSVTMEKLLVFPAELCQQSGGATRPRRGCLHHLLLSELMCSPGAKAKHLHFPFSPQINLLCTFSHVPWHWFLSVCTSCSDSNASLGKCCDTHRTLASLQLLGDVYLR